MRTEPIPDRRRRPRRAGFLAAAAGLLTSLAACVLPSNQASVHDFRVPTPRPPTSVTAGNSASAPPGTDLVITPTRPPGAGTPGPTGSVGPAGGGRLLLDADLNIGTPTFTVQALPPAFSLARYQLTGATGQSARIGDLTVDAATGRGAATVPDLPPGTYSILVVALESSGLVVASGTASTVVPAGGAASASVRVESPARQRVRIDLPAGEIPTPSFTVSCGDAGGAA